MAGLKIHLCPHLESAVNHYLGSDSPATPPRTAVDRTQSLTDLFAQPQTIWLVNSPGTKRWLQQRFTQVQGIFTDQPIDYVGRYLWSLVANCGADFPEISPFEPTLSVWVIQQWLENLTADDLSASGFAAALASSLRGAEAIEKHQLAVEIARLFDRYLLYRVDWLNRWQNKKLNNLGEHENWQAHLWRDLIYRLPRVQEKHPFLWLRDALGKPANHQPDLFADAKSLVLPQRIVLFGSDGLPTLHWSALQWLSAYCSVEVYSMIVCDEFHQDIVSQKQLWKQRLTNPEAAAYLEVGHPMLASWGSAQALAQAAIFDLNEQAGVSAQLTETSVAQTLRATTSGTSALRVIQQSVAQLQEPAFVELGRLLELDASIRIFNAPSHARQLASLEDQLIQAFNTDQQLKLSDVLVISTDIETTRRLIDGLWKRIAFRCSDFTKPTNAWLAAWLDWIDLSSGPITPIQAMALLTHQTVRNAFDIQTDEPELFQQWLHSAGVRELSGSSEPGQSRHSFDHGIERLLLGFATDGNNVAAPAWSRWPVQGVTEDHFESLEKLCSFIETLQGYGQRASQVTRLDQWIEWLSTSWLMLSEQGHHDPDPESSEGIAQAREALNEIEHHFRISGAQVAVNADIVLATVERHLQSARRPALPSGVVSVVQPDSLNHLPYKIIAWIGCDDKVWPRQTIPSRIDLMQQKPVAGDPHQREKDKSTFLSSLMNAQQNFWLFYTGRDSRSGALLNPSPLVSELLSWLPSLKPEVIPLLQESWQTQARAFAQRVEDFAWRKPNKDGKPIAPNRDDLIRFFRHPARFYLQQTEQMRQLWENDGLEDGLPWQLSKRDARQLLSVNLNDHFELNNPALVVSAALSDFPSMPASSVGQHLAVLSQDQVQRASENIRRLMSEQGVAFNISEPNQSAGLSYSLELVDDLNLHALAPIIVDWALSDNQTVYLYDLKSESLWQIDTSSERHLQAREQLVDTFTLHQEKPLPLFKKCTALWLLPLKRNAKARAFGDVLGDPFDDSSLSFLDASDQWNQYLWRGQWPTAEHVNNTLVAELSAFEELIVPVKKSSKASGAKK